MTGAGNKTDVMQGKRVIRSNLSGVRLYIQPLKRTYCSMCSYLKAARLSYARHVVKSEKRELHTEVKGRARKAKPIEPHPT